MASAWTSMRGLSSYKPPCECSGVCVQNTTEPGRTLGVSGHWVFINWLQTGAVLFPQGADIRPIPMTPSSRELSQVRLPTPACWGHTRTLLGLLLPAVSPPMARTPAHSFLCCSPCCLVLSVPFQREAELQQPCPHRFTAATEREHRTEH